MKMKPLTRTRWRRRFIFTARGLTGTRCHRTRQAEAEGSTASGGPPFGAVPGGLDLRERSSEEEHGDR